jgi:chromosome segregation ATPase
MAATKVLSLQEEIAALASQILECDREVQSCEKQLSETRERIAVIEQQHGDLTVALSRGDEKARTKLQDNDRERTDQERTAKGLQIRIDEARERSRQLNVEIQPLHQQSMADAAREKMDQATAKLMALFRTARALQRRLCRVRFEMAEEAYAVTADRLLTDPQRAQVLKPIADAVQVERLAMANHRVSGWQPSTRPVHWAFDAPPAWPPESERHLEELPEES